MEKVKNVLITGGSGMIGRRLTSLLSERGYHVFHLGRRKRHTGVRTFTWDPERNEIENGALQDADVIVHLAGAGVADKRWTKERKNEILLSRTKSARLLRETLGKTKHHVSTFISSSGISYYGLADKGTPFVESDPPADDFMARVTVAWENEADAFTNEGLRVARIRTGVVLSPEGGALKKLEMPVKFFVGAPLGTGKQYVNWIHIDDLCQIYIKALEDPSLQGAYNAVAPDPVTNRELTRQIAKVLKRPLWLPPVPGFIVKLVAGEVAGLVLKGGKISSQKIQDTGFNFQFGTIRRALEALHRPANMTRRVSSTPIQR